MNILAYIRGSLVSNPASEHTAVVMESGICKNRWNESII